MAGFERLHPAVGHHIANTLGWPALRPLQEAAIDPVLDGRSCLLLAPTAGGKTEAAMLPLLSRIVEEEWCGLSVLYVCPIKALINNLEPRLHSYLQWVGRRAALWHGDVGTSRRTRLVDDPPDLLLTTPESLEGMLTSRRVDHHRLLGRVRSIVIDEVHAFAGDDRGWHLLAVLERVAALSGERIQRIGLSATVGNPYDLAQWLVGSDGGTAEVVNPPVAAGPAPDVELDYVGSLSNAAVVISRLHHGEKRLVFTDSRARAEELTADLRANGVTTFVSHGSLAIEERRQAEQAFTTGSDCVIVATSTLELGIDVGDLDRVIQIDAPPTVASLLQRLGRSGRRSDTTRNCLLLATSDTALLHAAALTRLWDDGFVEPVVPPPEPRHLLVQQLLCSILQHGGAIGRNTWPADAARLPVLADIAADGAAELIDHLLGAGLLFADSGMLSFGPEGERSLGARAYRDLLSMITDDELVTVKHGTADLGRIHPLSFQTKPDQPLVIALGGRYWHVTFIDWPRKVAYVQPTEQRGKSRWQGTAAPLSPELCRAIRSVASGTDPGARQSRRAAERLPQARNQVPITQDGATVIVDDAGRRHWWTYAGLRGNLTLAAALPDTVASGTTPTNLALPLRHDLDLEEIRSRISGADVDGARPRPAGQDPKFASWLPPAWVDAVVSARALSVDAAQHAADEPIDQLLQT
ncbi:MAG: DEAD/DEAH box helicase [Acidimicrobiales bacterium]